MNKVEALRLKPGMELRVQYGNGRPLPTEKRIRVREVRWQPLRPGAVVCTAAIPLRSADAKETAAKAKWVSIISTDGEDFGSNEVVHIAEES